MAKNKPKSLIWATERRRVSQLVSFEHNPRKISPKQKEDLEKSLLKFNLVEIPAVNTDSKVIAGHQRLAIMKALGRGEEEIDVRVPNRTLTQAEVKEYLIRSNKNTGEWDFDLLKEHFDLNDLIEWGFTKQELPDFGFGEDLEDPDPELDKANELQVKWQTKSGQLWEIGAHKLLCGDSTKESDVKRLLGEKKADMMFTDPPYNVDYGANKKHPSWKIRSIANDKQSPEKWIEFVNSIATIAKEYVDGDCYVWGASGPDGMRMMLSFVEMGLHWSATIIWKKQQLVLSPAKYQRMYEPCLYGWFGNKSSFEGNRKQVEVWEVPRPTHSEEHPTMKPVKLAQMAIDNSSRKGDSILDLFIGSGTTMVAAEQTGRICYGMELEPKYVAVTLERMTKLNLKPKLVSNG